ncbi:tumor necrosis factor receptor superfamily member 5 isoform 2-T2 [Symphorus nematophorus]
MHLSRLTITIVCAFMVVMTAAQPHCDPLTQYEKHGDCCTMCGPGHSMSALSTCQQPQCQECRENEYQDRYTKETKCERQPYCDPNLNFETPVHDKRKQSTCTCKVGFHCSTEECLTCLPHATCRPGYGAERKGDSKHDTVCKKCPDGRFSNKTSWDHVCQEWTKCGHGEYIAQSGTDISDNICAKTSRTHIAVLGVVIPLILFGVVIALIFWQCRGKRGDAKGKICVESCLGEKHEPPAGATLITNPTDIDDLTNVDEESTCPQEESFMRTPEEIEDPTDVGSTDKGNFVTQETGKTAVLSRQESQPQAFID